MTNPATIVEQMLITHPSFVRAQEQLEQCFLFSTAKSEAEGLAIIGESGTGKTSVLSTFKDGHLPSRGADGMKVPVLFVTVPAGPTVKSLAGAMIHGFGASDSERGTENDKSRRLRTLMQNTGTRMIMLDEFQHFYDRGKHQIMRHVADWLKVLIDQTRTTLVVAGLPSCQIVINENEQLRRRFLAPIQLPRFDWFDEDQRKQFVDIMEAFNEKIVANKYETPELHSEEMAYQFWCASGGLIAYLSKLLRHTLRTADAEKRQIICLDDFAYAREASISLPEWPSGLSMPFEDGFELLPTKEIAKCVGKIGTVTEMLPTTWPRPVQGVIANSAERRRRA
jgi:hypothetical protein